MLGLHVDNRLGGTPRYYVAEKADHYMLLSQHIQKCVAFVAYKKSENDPYVKLGTAFFVSVPTAQEGRSFVYIVTAKHIIAKIKAKKLPTVWLRVNTHDGFIWVDTYIDDWKDHPDDHDCDVVAIGMSLNQGICDYKTIPASMTVTPEVISDEFIGVGEEVFLIGLFSKHTGTKKNLPIVRAGIISLMADPEEPVEVKIMGVRCEIEAYLIEARSIGGLSGSPVFVNLGHIRPGVAKTRGQIYWLGLMHGHWDIEPRPDEYEEDTSLVPLSEKVNMGIAIVVPATKIREVIDQPYFAEIRKRHDDKAREEDLPTPDMVEDDDETEYTEEDFEKALEKVTRRDKPEDDKGKGKRKKSG